MNKYYNFQIKKAVTVKNLVTIEKLELTTEYCYPEEVHTFYEFAYVDAGELVCRTENGIINLSPSDFYLIPPAVKHSYQVRKDRSATIFILCFNCKSDILEIINGKTTLKKEEKNIIADIIKEADNAFKFPFKTKLKLLDNPVFGAQQLIESKIEEILIKLVRNKVNADSDIKLVMNTIELENSLVNDVIALLKHNLYSNVISLDYVSQKTFYSKTYLNNIFKKNTGSTIMKYNLELKIQEAKKLLRSGVTVSKVSDMLYFDNPNYFSKTFKKITNLTPSQYKKNIL